MAKLPIFLLLCLLSLACWAQGADIAPAVAAPLAFDVGNVSFPAALVISSWLVSKWKPELKLYVETGPSLALLVERVADKGHDMAQAIVKAVESMHRRLDP